MSPGGPRRLGAAEAERGLRDRDRGVLARAITLVESVRDRDRTAAEDLLGRIAPLTGHARRVGISGPPGVGKSTLIDALGSHLIGLGLSPAVLAVDPSSQTTGGSILGDKTRMPRIAFDPRAYVRPSPAADHLGGVARKTREAMLLCEAFGFDVVIVETVGVGQSETEVASMVDTFVLLAQGGAGDELQGIKRGIMERVDVVAVNKADGDGLPSARRATRDLSAALHLMRRRFDAWSAKALMVSAKTGQGIDELWRTITEHRDAIERSGELASLRGDQAKRWLRTEVETRLFAELTARPEVRAKLAELETRVSRGEIPASVAATDLFALFKSKRAGS